MKETDNFRHHKPSPSNVHAIDVVMKKRGVFNGGSIGFQDSHKKRDTASSQTGNFSRMDGFHPATQAAISATPKTPSQDIISDRPRRSPFQKTDAPVKPKRQKKVRSRRYKIIKRSLLSMAALFILIGGFLGWKVLRNTSKIFGGGG